MKIFILFILLTFFVTPVSYGESNKSTRKSNSSGHVQMLMMMEAEQMAEEMLMQNSPSAEGTNNKPESTNEFDKVVPPTNPISSKEMPSTNHLLPEKPTPPPKQQ